MSADQYAQQMEEIRTNLLAGIPQSLLEASRDDSTKNHNDSHLERAMDFLNANTSDQDWKHNLFRYVVLKESTPAKLAEFPSDLVSRLLEGSPDLLQEMIIADGASDGNWPKAMEIYEGILRESDCVENNEDHPVLHRLAVAVALVHATPVKQRNVVEPDPDQDPPDEFVDPIRRYHNYECAYLEGELDPAFSTLTTWELRYVVYGEEPDEIAGWGRRALKNFYPQHALQSHPDWSYALIVKTDIPYGSSRVHNDDPKLHFFQNILCNGGICGRRAFFGRFILRAFGIPNTARPSKGHAALCHWTGPNTDWTVNLGGGWGRGWTATQYGKDLDFLATSKARRRNHGDYQKVKLAQFLGDLNDEKRLYGIHDASKKGERHGVPLTLQDKSVVGLWYRLSLKVQESILNGPPGRGHGFSRSQLTTVIESTRKQSARNGSCVHGQNVEGKPTICVPAASLSNPGRTKHVTVMHGFCDSGETGCNQQVYLSPFNTEGTTILRGGSWKTPPGKFCLSGYRLLSGGKGRYEDWGFRVAMNFEDELDAADPEPTVKVSLNDDESVIIEFVYIPPGQFVMGGTSTTDGKWHCLEVPHHNVKVTKGFYMGKYPVTQEQYQLITGKKPSRSTKDPKCPVDNVGIDDDLSFAQKVSDITGRDVRLPTEAEWEYAARGSTEGDKERPHYFFGDDRSLMDKYAWYGPNSEGKSHPVGLKLPNPFGLYDVYGNVQERVSDTYKKEYYAECEAKGVVEDPNGASQGSKSHFRCDVPGVPIAGKYQLTAKVCTATTGQRMIVSRGAEGKGGKEFVLKFPYTVAEWMESEPVVLNMKEGNNTLHFWRDSPPQYGVSIKEFTFTLVKEIK
mmetsp:Transcript_12491/g.35472  ORF Transcript_12491/g.35472 Transcript_12491/m.35472 type:complete len:852 (+) Transcript_12491:438-2993(+)|eukprot:CAMPEP_0172359034 /NCGR_PEP_ID=MMETSP1060-20121228/3262_1 /TAXON_ID=37318 /ORGANISM="Pseudo-nitzschia pungens, Strain cf. cingulata" /LENGTH=851 /DNA_ID=CAMNT_0013080485 /DNA_START=418 /DNA_END=2973 /DNA_ORIENTATION=+